MTRRTAKLKGSTSLKRTHWGRRILAAEKRGRFTEDDERKANMWPSCACGKQDPRIPRYIGEFGHDEGIYQPDEPRDRELRLAGVKFGIAVSRNNFPAAWAALAAIEKRAGEILAQIDKEGSK